MLENLPHKHKWVELARRGNDYELHVLFKCFECGKEKIDIFHKKLINPKPTWEPEVYHGKLQYGWVFYYRID